MMKANANQVQGSRFFQQLLVEHKREIMSSNCCYIIVTRQQPILFHIPTSACYHYTKRFPLISVFHIENEQASERRSAFIDFSFVFCFCIILSSYSQSLFYFVYIISLFFPTIHVTRLCVSTDDVKNVNKSARHAVRQDGLLWINFFLSLFFAVAYIWIFNALSRCLILKDWKFQAIFFLTLFYFARLSPVAYICICAHNSMLSKTTWIVAIGMKRFRFTSRENRFKSEQWMECLQLFENKGVGVYWRKIICYKFSGFWNLSPGVLNQRYLCR